MRSVLITVGSLMLTAGVLTNAYIHKRQFYPSVVYITKSSPSMAVLYLQALVFVVLLGKLMRQIFFSQLRSAELEHLIERSWYAVTETCLAFTVFRDDFSPRFVALFTILLFLKCFHWLAEDRVDYMERSPVITWLFHIRAVSLLALLGFLDIFFVSHAYSNTLIKGPSVQLVFGFEYAILLMIVTHIFVKYVLHTIDVQSENPWENKAVYLLYAELVLGLAKCCLYFAFLAIMVKVHTFPLFVIRPMYLAVREFRKAVNDVIMSRRAIRNMNTLYPDASEADLAAGDNVCIICREEMHTSCKKLPCNHIFHTNCLRSWFQRQQTCPTCRMDVLRQPPVAGASAAAAAAREHAQQQAAQPVQQLPQPPQFPGFLGGMAAPAGMYPPWMPPQQAPPPATTTATSTAGFATPPGIVAPPGPFPMFGPPPAFAPFMMSPPPLVLPPFAIPTLTPGLGSIPPPPPGTLGLSDEELRAMEGEERRNVEARIRCLQDINILLTAALTQMQQYTTVTAGLTTAQPTAAAAAQLFTNVPAAASQASSTAQAAAPQASTTAQAATQQSIAAGATNASKLSTHLGAIPKTPMPSTYEGGVASSSSGAPISNTVDRNSNKSSNGSVKSDDETSIVNDKDTAGASAAGNDNSADGLRQRFSADKH